MEVGCGGRGGGGDEGVVVVVVVGIEAGDEGVSWSCRRGAEGTAAQGTAGRR